MKMASISENSHSQGGKSFCDGNCGDRLNSKVPPIPQYGDDAVIIATLIILYYIIIVLLYIINILGDLCDREYQQE